MKINYIQYYNYRCFEQNTRVVFNTTKEKNIALIMGVTGTGKTEMLFSFQWVLYGFDFKSLREKDETPYSLNSGLYHELERNRNAQSVDCWVELSFTYNGTEYFMKRTERFMRNNDKVTSVMYVSLSHTEPNGQRTPPEKDKDKVEELLSRIIPKSILEGITFDGERMKKLSIVGDQSKDTIKSVISLITNERLFDLCLEEIKDVKSGVSTEKQRINKKSGNYSAEELEIEIKDLEDSIDENKIKLKGIEKNQEKVSNELAEISEKLSQLKEAQDLEQKYKGLQKDLDKAKRAYDQSLEQFYKRLSDGYSLVTDRLVADVKNSLQNIDVPAGLTVEAVKSILKRPNCICGCEMTHDIQQRLNDLLSTLPPDNISSTLLYMADQFENDKRKMSGILKDEYNHMQRCAEEVANCKIEIAKIASSLVTNASAEAQKLGTRREELLRLEGSLKQDEIRCNNEIDRLSKRLKVAKVECEQASGNSDLLKKLTAQQDVLEKYKKAITMIGERNQELSLLSINDYLSSAYDLLSADKDRSIYICQHDKKEKYGLVTYIKSEFTRLKTNWTNSGRLKALRDSNLSESEICEQIIIQSKEGKSTGQSKVNSLAFAKAILDYSNEGSNNGLTMSHDYPFLIDSPFTELSGGNLFNVAEYIHTFAYQIILMADDQSYGGVQSRVAKYVKNTSHLIKNEETSITSIK